MRRPARRYHGTARNAPVRPGKRWSTAQAVGRVVAGLVAAFAMAWAADRLLVWVSTTPQLAVRQVELRGVENADANELRRLLALDGMNIVALDLRAARERLVAEPWVADAALRRRLPSTVVAVVTERRPVAFVQVDGHLAVLGDAGLLLEQDVSAERFGLPLLVGGDERRTQLAARTLAALRERAPAFFGDVTRVDCTRPDRITLLTEDGPAIHVAGPESIDELERWLRGAETVVDEVGPLRYVDARWSGRVFLGRDES